MDLEGPTTLCKSKPHTSVTWTHSNDYKKRT